MSHWISLLTLLALMVVLLEKPHSTAAQITFSKDWRAGGKRSEQPTSFGTTLHSRGLSMLDVPCEQLESYSTSKIRDLVRKEAVALLQCETTLGTKSNPPHTSNQDI